MLTTPPPHTLFFFFFFFLDEGHSQWSWPLEPGLLHGSLWTCMTSDQTKQTWQMTVQLSCDWLLVFHAWHQDFHTRQSVSPFIHITACWVVILDVLNSYGGYDRSKSSSNWILHPPITQSSGKLIVSDQPKIGTTPESAWKLGRIILYCQVKYKAIFRNLGLIFGSHLAFCAQQSSPWAKKD